MATMRYCPVYRADVVFEMSCVTCPAADQMRCLVISGEATATIKDGQLVVTKRG